MDRRLILIICFALAACASPGTPTASQEPNPTVVTEEPTANTEVPTAVTEEGTTPPATEAPTQAPIEPTPWDNTYDPSTFDDPRTALLCPENGPADEQPRFGEVTTGTLEAQEIAMRHGLYANEQNEVFRIDVIAPSPSAESMNSLNEYVDNLKVCFDHILLQSRTGPIAEPAPEASMPEPFGSNPEDLAVEVYMQGYAGTSLSRDEVRLLLEGIVSQPVEEWTGLLKQNKVLTPQEAYPDKVGQDFLLAYIFDPGIGSGVRHQYTERMVNSIYVNASVHAGSGSVTAGLCRNYSLLPSTTMTVTHGSWDTDARSDEQATNYTYDLAVRGGSSGGRYRISGLWSMPGWGAGYWDAARSGDMYSCNP